MSDNPFKDYSCPSCKKRSIETAVTAPYIRGFLLAYQMGTKKFVGCTGCARGELLKEAGLSMLVGWFSPTSLLLNPAFILWNFLRAPFVRANAKAVEKLFMDAGIPLPGQNVDIPHIMYAMATAMIAADGKILPAEVETATNMGRSIVENFDEAAFKQVLDKHKSLPDIQRQARLLANTLDDGGKRLVLRFLLAIAKADGEFDRKEKRLLTDVGRTLVGEAFSAEAFERQTAKAA